MFITFEGGEGSGKSSQARFLADALRAEGHAVWLTREPGGTPLAEALRQALLFPEATVAALRAAGMALGDGPVDLVAPATELLLMNAARAQHVIAIRRRLADGVIVISDRFADSTIAYQSGGRGLDRAATAAVIAAATDGLTPDLTVLLDLDPAVGLGRKAAGDLNRFDSEALAFHERVTATFRALAASEPARWLTLDATRPADAQAATILAAVRSRLQGY